MFDSTRDTIRYGVTIVEDDWFWVVNIMAGLGTKSKKITEFGVTKMEKKNQQKKKTSVGETTMTNIIWSLS